MCISHLTIWEPYDNVVWAYVGGFGDDQQRDSLLT